jgi:hypothetical protein
MLSGLVLIVAYTALIDGLTSVREDYLLSYDTAITKGRFIDIVPRFLPSPGYAPELSANVHYSYIVDGVEYIQSDKRFMIESFDKATMENISVIYSKYNPLVSRIVID